MRSLIRQIKRTYLLAGAAESKVVLANVASLSWLSAISYILPMILLPYLFRILGVEKFGLIAFASAFSQYFMIMTDYGFSVTATKEIALHRNDTKKTHTIFSAVMTVKLLLAFLSFLILCTIVFSIPRFKNDWMVYLLSFGSVIGNTLFPIWFFQGNEKMKYIANINIIAEILLAFLILSLVKTPNDYLLVPALTSTVFLFSGICGLYIALSHFKIKFQLLKLSHLHTQLKSGWDLFTSIIAINTYTTTRVFAIGLLTNNTMTGYYSMAEKIASVVQTFPLSSFSQAIFPRMSKIYSKNRRLAFETMVQVQEITMKISLITIPLFFIAAPYLVGMICGGGYPEITLTLRLLLVSIFFICANAFRVQFLLVCGKTQTYANIHIVMALLGLPLILILISGFSYVGAAIATLIIEAGICCLTILRVRQLKF